MDQRCKLKSREIKGYLLIDIGIGLRVCRVLLSFQQLIGGHLASYSTRVAQLDLWRPASCQDHNHNTNFKIFHMAIPLWILRRNNLRFSARKPRLFCAALKTQILKFIEYNL